MASISEQLAPLLPGFRYNPKDAQWIGGGGAVDAIVWNGLEAGGEVEVVFLDVKVGRQVRFTDKQAATARDGPYVWRVLYSVAVPADPWVRRGSDRSTLVTWASCQGFSSRAVCAVRCIPAAR